MKTISEDRVCHHTYIMVVLRYNCVAGIEHKALLSLINEAKFVIVIPNVRSKIYHEF